MRSRYCTVEDNCWQTQSMHPAASLRQQSFLCIPPRGTTTVDFVVVLPRLSRVSFTLAVYRATVSVAGRRQNTTKSSSGVWGEPNSVTPAGRRNSGNRWVLIVTDSIKMFVYERQCKHATDATLRKAERNQRVKGHLPTVAWLIDCSMSDQLKPTNWHLAQSMESVVYLSIRPIFTILLHASPRLQLR